MKKIRFVVCLTLVVLALFSMAACANKENGVTIKYATVKLSFTDEDGKARTEDVAIKLYVNYAPESIARFIKLAEEGFYDNTVVNTAESSWISLGGYKEEDGLLKSVSYGADITGEFAKNGWKGNKLTISRGAVVMYRRPSDSNGNNYDTANCSFAICNSTSAPFKASEYCIIGKVENDSLKVISDIIALRDKYEEDTSLTTYKRYYAGGIDSLAAAYVKEDGTFNESLADSKNANIEAEDVEKVMEGGEFYYEPGFIEEEDYTEFYNVAYKFIKAINGSDYEYFFTVPYNTVKINGVKITDRI